MPTYAYRCESCGNQYEKREGFSAPARQKCPKCGKTATRVLFAPPIVFKGSGFYKTDSRGSGADDGFTPAAASPAGDHAHSHGPGEHGYGDSNSSSDDPATEGAAAG